MADSSDRRVTAWAVSHQRELLSSVTGMLRCGSPQLMASGMDAGGEGLSSIWGVGHWEFEYAPEGMRTTQIGRVFILGMGVTYKGEGMHIGRLGSEYESQNQ